MSESSPTTYGHQSSPDVMRFKLTTTLSPGGSAACRHAGYSPNDHDFFDLNKVRTVYDPHYRHFGLSGEYGWARRMPDSHQWEMLGMEGCLMRHGKVYTTVAANGTGTIKLWKWNPDAGPAAESDTGIVITVRDFQNKTWAINDRVFVYYEPISRSWYILGSAGGSSITFFELTADLVYATPPAADNAKVLEWTGAAYAPTGATIRVWDWLVNGTYGQWTGRAPAGALAGYQGAATLGPSGRYEIIWMEEQAKWIKFKITSQLKYNAASVAGTLLNKWDGRELPAGTLTLYNTVTDLAGNYKFWGPANAVGYAVWDETDGTGKYKIVVLETQAKKIEFTLASGSAGAAAFGATGVGGINISAGATVFDSWDGKIPAGTVTITDPRILFPRACVGAKGLAIFNEQYDAGTGAYEVFQCESKAGWIDFTLVNPMASGTSTGATVNRYGGTQQDIQDPGSAVVVYDDQDLWKYAPAGAKGRAIYDGSQDRYRIVECSNKAKWIKFTITTSSLAASDASKSGQTVDDYWGGVNPGASVTLYNQEASSNYIFSGAVGHKGLAVWDEIDDKYRIVQMECP